MGRRYKHRGRPVIFLVAGDHVRVIAEDGELLRELSLDPDSRLPAFDHTYTGPGSGETAVRFYLRHDIGQGPGV